MVLRIKICGITQPNQGRAIAEMGATALGFICTAASPRYVLPQQIRKIVAELPANPATGQPCDRIGVFVNASLEEIRQVVAVGNLNGVQLHGSETPEFCQQLRQQMPGIELIKALRIRSPEALSEANSYQPCVDALLLDAYHPTQMGGTGNTLDWTGLQQFRSPLDWFLAGGLSPDNIGAALHHLSPSGIDLSSGVEQAPGIKDLHKVEQLFAQIQIAVVLNSSMN